MSRLLLRMNNLLQKLEQSLFGRGFPHGNYDCICLNSNTLPETKEKKATQSVYILLLNSKFLYQKINNFFSSVLDSLCLAGIPNYSLAQNVSPPSKPFSLKELIGDGILWAVPKSRRSIEKRLKRRFGKNNTMICKINTRLQMCSKCGYHKEVGILCRK